MNRSRRESLATADHNPVCMFVVIECMRRAANVTDDKVCAVLVLSADLMPCPIVSRRHHKSQTAAYPRRLALGGKADWTDCTMVAHAPGTVGTCPSIDEFLWSGPVMHPFSCCRTNGLRQSGGSKLYPLLSTSMPKRARRRATPRV